MRGAVKGHRSWWDSKLLPHGYSLSTHRARLDHVLGFSTCCSVGTRAASSLLLGLLVGGPGLFSTHSSSARATCTPRRLFVTSGGFFGNRRQAFACRSRSPRPRASVTGCVRCATPRLLRPSARACGAHACVMRVVKVARVCHGWRMGRGGW